MPMCPSSGALPDMGPESLAQARAVGFPVLIKPTVGGGIGMLAASDEKELAKVFEQSKVNVVAKSFWTQQSSDLEEDE